MGWPLWIAFGAAGLGTMRAAIDRGDVEEAARQGSLAGPKVIQRALAAPDRPARLAGIAAAPSSVDRESLLDPLATLAANPDRRTALPAAHAARTIARELAKRADPPDDVALEDIAIWRDRWATLARDPDHWIELRVIALDTAVALDRSSTLDLGPAFTDPDPAFRRAAIAVVPTPIPAKLHVALAQVVIKDTDGDVALAAAAILCTDLDAPKPILDALGTPGLDRIRALVAGKGSPAMIKDAKRCR